MHLATAYRRHNGFYVHSNAQTTSGVWVASRPFTKIPSDAGAEILGQVVEEALQASQTGIEHPNDWDAVEYPLPELAGVKSWSTFMKNARCASIKEVDGIVELTPSRNLGPERGYEPFEDAAIVVRTGDRERIATALLDAFKRCC